MKRRSSDPIADRLRGKGYDELRERAGRDWMAICAHIHRCDPRTDTWVKSISIRIDRDGCFIVMRGRYGADDVVQLRQAGQLEYALSFIAYMLHKGVWKPDKYGVDGNSVLREKLEQS